MRVDKAIKWLSEYKPDEEIFIAWWDKETSYGELTDEQWKQVINKLDDNDYMLEDVTYAIDQYIREVVKSDEN